MNILAIDPGKLKCGLAVMQSQQMVLEKMIVSLDDLFITVKHLCEKFEIELIVIGDRTNSKVINNSLKSLAISMVKVDEDCSSLEGRQRYLIEHTKGLARLVPIGLRVPKEPYDDYVAVVLAERYFSSLNNDQL